MNDYFISFNILYHEQKLQSIISLTILSEITRLLDFFKRRFFQQFSLLNSK